MSQRELPNIWKAQQSISFIDHAQLLHWSAAWTIKIWKWAKYGAFNTVGAPMKAFRTTQVAAILTKVLGFFFSWRKNSLCTVQSRLEFTDRFLFLWNHFSRQTHIQGHKRENKKNIELHKKAIDSVRLVLISQDSQSSYLLLISLPWMETETPELLCFLSFTGAFGIDRSYSYSASLGKYYNKGSLSACLASH